MDHFLSSSATLHCIPMWGLDLETNAVADLGGVRGVQMHPPLVASNVFLRK